MVAVIWTGNRGSYYGALFSIFFLYGSDPRNSLISLRKRPKRGGFLGLKGAFWGLKMHLLGKRDAKSLPLWSWIRGQVSTFNRVGKFVIGGYQLNEKDTL